MKDRRRTSGPSFALALLCGIALGAHAADIVVSVDRTTQDWSDLSMGRPASDDDADRARNPRALLRYVPAYGKATPTRARSTWTFPG